MGTAGTKPGDTSPERPGNPPGEPDTPDALIIIDMQKAFLHGPNAIPSAKSVLAQVTALLHRARAAPRVQIIHLQNDGPVGAPDEPHTPGWELALPACPSSRETVLRKTDDDGFVGTALGALLDARRVRRVVLCGVQSEMCVAATARAAMSRGLHVVLPHDAHGTYDVPAADELEAPAVPAPQVARVAEWSLGDGVEITARAADVRFDDGP